MCGYGRKYIFTYLLTYYWVINDQRTLKHLSDVPLIVRPAFGDGEG